jgi:hypothetical protein
MSPLTPRRLTRIAFPLLGVAGVASLLAGCGGGGNPPGVANIGTTTTPQTTTNNTSPGSGGGNLGTSSGGGGNAQFRMRGGANSAQFASCMRKNGVPNFPDPNAQGVISIGSSSGVDPSSQQFQSAQRACAKYLPNGGQPPSPAEQAKFEQQALKFSACMRSHGVPNFPDPDFGKGTVRISIGPSSGIDPQSPAFQAAQKACQGLLPGKAGPAPAGASTANPPSSAGGK